MSQEHETFGLSHSLYEKYQMLIHGDHESDCGKDQFLEFLVESPLKVFRLLFVFLF